MYESELNSIVESSESVPSEVLGRLAEFRDHVHARSILPWGEHCTECNWPVCYTTCELYTPRSDGDCRLFVEGMVRVDVESATTPYLLKIKFKRWGKLWTVGNTRLLSQAEATKKERSNILVGGVVRSLPLPSVVKVPIIRKARYFRKREAEEAIAKGGQPDSFVIECYNPNDRTIDLTVTFAPHGTATALQYFQTKVQVAPGFIRERIPVAAISRRLDLSRPFGVEIVPNDCDDTVLYFGLLDFVKEHHAPASNAAPKGKKWKCIVWDLDNTLWQGVLVEDGPEGIRLRQDVVDIIKEADRRGILHSIASKNNHEDAIALLKRLGLDEYFLHPQINWEPKSQSVARIAELLNIGIDSIAFVDDQPFEREEVKSATAVAAVVDAMHCADILSRPECDVPVTDESRQRRLMYRDQESRELAQRDYGGDYRQFLKDCDIRLTLSPLDDGNIDRVYELAQRTNQMNFTGRRYAHHELRDIMESPLHGTSVIRCVDRFGGYGIVGFALVDKQEPRLLDLMFSCRIQSKRVEHAVITTLLKEFVGDAERDMLANYRPTARNAACGKAFEEVGFTKQGETDGVVSFVFDRKQPIPDEGIVRIDVAEREQG